MRGTAAALAVVLTFARLPAWGGPPELLARAGPAMIASGPVGAGQTLASLPVRHRLTGRLKNRIVLDSVFGKDAPLQPGQPVFGIPAPGGGTIWCAPRRSSGGAAWRTACLTPSHAGLYEWEIGRTPAMAPADIGQVDGLSSGQASAAPVVQPGPVPLPPMTLSLVLEDVAPDGRLCDVDLMLDWGDGPQPYGHLQAPMTSHGGVATVMGMTLKLRPGPGPGQVRVSKPWSWPR